MDAGLLMILEIMAMVATLLAPLAPTCEIAAPPGPLPCTQTVDGWNVLYFGSDFYMWPEVDTSPSSA